MSLFRKKTKYDPVAEKEYIVTDQCFWEKLTDEQKKKYNPYDPKRAPHTIQLVDPETGTVVHLESGSRVKIITAKT